jgi:hypothetical protein
MSYDDLLQKLIESIRGAVSEGFIGLKGHIGERFTMDVREVSDSEARASFVKAQQGDKKSQRTCIFAMFPIFLSSVRSLTSRCIFIQVPPFFKKRTDVYKIDQF